MRIASFLFAFLLLSAPAVAMAAETSPAATSDGRYPVQVTPQEALQQKAEMRGNLVALRDTLSRLADDDFEGVERSLHHLAHAGPPSQRPGVSTEVFRKLEREFEESVDKAVEAAKSKDSKTVLRALSDTMAFCQSCHSAFRQAVAQGGAAPDSPAAATAH